MATITIKGYPAQEPLYARICKNYKQKKQKNKSAFFSLLNLPFVLIFVILTHFSYIINYRKQLLTFRHDLTEIDIPKELRIYSNEKIFCSFPRDRAEEISYDTNQIRAFIRDVEIGPTFTTERHKMITDEVVQICKKHFPNLSASAEIKGAKTTGIFSELP